MVTWYEFAKWVHVFCAVIWVGGDIMTQALAIRIMRANDPIRMAGFARDVERIGMWLLTPAAVLLLVFGFVLVEEGDWGYPFWVIFGLIVLAVAAISGIAFFGPESGRIGKLIEAHGPEYPEVQVRLRRVLTYSRITTVLLILVVFDMVIKPFD